MSAFFAILLAAMTSADALVTLLNTSASVSASRYAKALELVEREAFEGKPLQQFVIGVITDDRIKAAKYLDAARPKIRQMAEKRDNALAWYLLSMENNDFKMLQHAADLGNVQALNAMGTIATQQAFDQKVPTNKLEVILRKSFDCFHRAAAQRDPNGLVNLGTCYLRGFGCDIDFGLAYECFKSAAESGHPEAMDYVSASYEKGFGVKKSAEKSLFWRMKAKALRGDKAALEWLRSRKCR